MILTSAEFQTVVNSDERRSETLVAVHFGRKPYIPTVTATSTDPSTTATQAGIGRIRYNDYQGSGSYISDSYKSKHVGWLSGAKSDGSGVFTTNQELIVNYGEVITNSNFWFIADPFYYPVDFDLMLYISGQWLLEKAVVGNTSENWSYVRSTPKSFSQVKLVIKKMSAANQAVRIIHFGAVTTVLFEKEDIVDFVLIEEKSSSSNSPLGAVTSNEFSLTINNEFRWFTLDNKNSPFYGLIKQKVRIEPYAGYEISANNIEFVPLGVFRLSDCNSPSSSLESSITAYDRLYDIISLPVPSKIPVRGATNLRDFFIYLFTSLGFSDVDYDIDDSIADFPLTMAWLPDGFVGDALQKLSDAGNCSVYVNRFDVIRVRSNMSSGTPVSTLDDNNQIVYVDNPHSFFNTFSSVKIDCHFGYLSEIKQVAFLSQITLPPGVTVLKDISFSEGPVGNIVAVMEKDSNAKINSISATTWKMDLTVQNTTNADIVIDISVLGRTINFNATQVSAIDQNLYDLGLKQEVIISNEYIQHLTSAQNYANSLLKFVSDAKAFYNLDIRCNPSLELFDLINIQSTTDHIDPTQVVIVSNRITYDSGFDGSIRARKVIS